MSDLPQISAASAVVIASDTGRVLYSKDPERRRAMASLTKIMTALIAIERSQLPPNDERHRALDGWVKVGVYPLLIKDDDTLGFALGEEVRLRDLLYAVMLRSSPDATRAVAEHIVGRASADFEEGKVIRDEFIHMMNDRAEALGLEATHFRNSSGQDPEDDDGCPQSDPFHDEVNCGHYSSADNLATLARYAMSNSTFADIVRTSERSFSSNVPLNGSYKVYNGLNRFYNSYPGVGGVKSGKSGRAGQCRVYYATLLGKSIIAVTLNSDDADGVSRKDNHALLDYGFGELFALKRKHSLSRTGVIHSPRITPLGPNRVVTAVRDAEGRLEVSGWHVSTEGIVTRIDSDSPSSMQDVTEIDIGTLGTDKVVTAARDGDGHLELTTWSVTPDARISRLGDSTPGPAGSYIHVRGLSGSRAVTVMKNADGVPELISWRLNADGSWTLSSRYLSSVTDLGGPVAALGLTSYCTNSGTLDPPIFRVVTGVKAGRRLSLVSCLDSNGIITYESMSKDASECTGDVAMDYQVVFGQEQVLTAARRQSGDLEVVTWQLIDGLIMPLFDSENQAHAASEICVAGLYPGWLCTAVRTGAGNLKLITWRFSKNGRDGKFGRFVDTGSAGDPVSTVALCQLTSDMYVTAAKTNDGNLELTSWKLEAP